MIINSQTHITGISRVSAPDDQMMVGAANRNYILHTQNTEAHPAAITAVYNSST